MKRRTLFRRLMFLVILAILCVAGTIGFAFLRIAGPVFTKAKAGEILPRVEAVAEYYLRYVEGTLDLRDMQAAIAVSGTLSNAQLHIYDASGALVIFSLDNSPEFLYPANSLEMRAVTLPVALEAMRAGANATQTVLDKGRRVEFMVVAASVVRDGDVVGAVVLTSPMAVVRYPLQRLSAVLLLSCIIAFILMLFPLYYVLRRMVKPLQQMNTVALSMAQGDFSRRADENTRGEIGELAHSINHLAERLGQTVQTLLFERNRLQHLINGLAEGILALDENGALLFSNPALYSLLGIEADERGLQDALGALDDSLIRDIRAVGENGAPLTRDLAASGRTLRITATTIVDEGGAWRGVVALLRDITESERLEQTRRDYVANVSHELRTPLSALRGLAEALQDGLVKTQQDKSRYYGYILRECMRLGRLIEDLLELSRLQSGNVALQKQAVSLPQLLEDIRMRYATVGEDLGIDFAIDCPPACPAAHTNADRVAQVLVILLDNAFKFTGEGGRVRVYTTHDDEQIRVCVEDGGAGIAKEDLPHVFERFYKAEKARSGEGTGLGLSIAREVLTLLGESISVTSEAGKGSTFCFTLQRAGA